jgi:diphthine synthase
MPGLRIENLRQVIGKPVQILSREEVEESAEDKILSKANSGKVAFLVAGDPMVATTHIDLRLRAQKAGIKTRIIHAASVASAAAGVTGLQSYKFGRTVTVPLLQRDGLPESVYKGIELNLELGFHSLVLLEVDVENRRHVSIPQALDRLLGFSERTPNPLIKPDTLVVGVARLEAPDMIVLAGTVSEIMRVNFGEPPHSLIFPGTLHFVEAEALEVFCGAGKELVAERKEQISEDPAARARKYIANLTMAVDETTINAKDASVKAMDIARVADAIQRYLQDAKHYFDEGRATTSLASVAYAEGLLDALKFLELTQQMSSQ